MATTNNSTKATAASTNAPVSKTESATKTPAVKNTTGSQHVADQIKAFPKRRVWPD